MPRKSKSVPLSKKKPRKQYGDTSDPYILGKVNLVQHVERRLWNKAVSMIDDTSSKPSNSKPLCFTDFASSHHNPSKNSSVRSAPVLMFEIRQSMLRHDWRTVHQLISLLLESSRRLRTNMNKLCVLLLLASPYSSWKNIKEFSSMILGTDSDEDIETFVRTVCKIPKSLPRGRVRYHYGQIMISSNGNWIKADSYLNDSRAD